MKPLSSLRSLWATSRGEPRVAPRVAPRIDLVSPDLFGAHGGIARIASAMALALARWADAHGTRLHAHALHDPADALDSRFVPEPHGFSGYGGSRARLAASLLARSATPRPRIVVFAHPNLAVLSLGLPPWARSVVVAHGIDVWQPLRGDRARALRRAAALWPVSRNTAWYLEAVQELEPERITVIPNALNPFWPLPARGSLGGLGEGPSAGLLTLARLHPDDAYKGIDLTLEALARLPRETRPPLIVAGDGPDRPRLEGLATGLGVNAQFVGRVSDEALAGLFRQARAFVLPSSGEGFGLVYLEAMAFGLPCIAARAGGAPEVVLDGVTGLVVPPREPAALAAAITRVCGPEGAAWGLAGRERLERELLYPRYEARVHAALDALVGAAGR